MGWFSPKSVDTILATFQKTIDELDGHAEDQQAKASYHRNKAGSHSVWAKDAEDEAFRAVQVSKKIRELVQ